MHASSFDSEFREGVIRVVAETDGIRAVCVEGEFDLANARALEERIADALNDGGSLIVDLSEATFIDSTVIALLLRLGKSSAVQHKAVVLQLARASIAERTIEAVGIERLLPRAHDRQEAVRIIQQQRKPDEQRRPGPEQPEQRRDRAGRNQSLFRDVNAQISALSSAPADGETITYLCECLDVACLQTIEMPRGDYQRIRSNPTDFFVVPGHEDPRTEEVVDRGPRWVVVRKIGSGTVTAAEPHGAAPIRRSR